MLLLSRITDSTTSIRFVDQSFIAEVHQHRMVLEIKPTAEDIKTAVRRPSAFIREPTRQLPDKNFLAQFLQDFPDILFRVTLGDQVDRRFLNQLTQAETAAGWIGRVQPVQKGLSWLHHDCRSIQHRRPRALHAQAARRS